ncbi:MAG: PLP-dependent aminotransferase family protein [Acidobacteria bacterium]|nr:PLP-dependent aminotransferase family protein [Acidobacteriota bacterium]MBV9476802.1 PLP-dependent aminotransferase family protein [Acidobacteriota bacterium]
MRRGALLSSIAALRWSGNVRTTLYRELRCLITGGHLRAGSRLPSTRMLARDLGISRNSVLAAFERLTAEGLIVSRHGSGSFVSRFAAGKKPHRAAIEHDPHLRVARRRETSEPRDVRPAAEHFPLDAWQRCMRAVANSLVAGDLHHDVAPALQCAIAEHLAATRGVRCDARQVAVFNTKREAIEFAMRVATDRGDAVASTDPDDLVELATVLGVRVVDRDATPQLMHCTSFAESRRDVLAIASRAHAWVLEDDAYGHFATDPTLYSGDRHGRVLYLGTFADVLHPVEIAFLVLPERLATSVRSGVSVFDQHVLAAFIAGGYLAAHMRRLRAMIAARREALLRDLCATGCEIIVRPLHIELRGDRDTTRIPLADLFPPNADAITGSRRIA